MCQIKIILGTCGCNTDVGKEDNFKLTVGSKSLNEADDNFDVQV
jgi:hypothetical protein